MLRITVHDTPDCLTFQLEGKLAGPWVPELQECWMRRPVGARSAVRFDLTGVTFIDAAGKAFLGDMHREGAEFIAVDCLTRAIVAEILNAPALDCGGPKPEEQHQAQPKRGRLP
jgi:anti-anti-sigma regulatory factor